MTDNGERPSRLANTFDRAIMRHRPEHVRLAFSLPPITRRVVEIAMEECERKVYNALIATFVSNAITSQRIDVDYLFHPSKSHHLNLLCDNLAAATTFFGSSEFHSFAFDARKFAKEVLAGKKSLDWTEDERGKEHKVVSVLSEVLDDREALLTAGEPSIAFEVFGLPEELLATFRGLPAERSLLNRTLVSANELVRLRVDLKELRHADVKAWSDDEELVEELITFEEKRKRIDARPKSYKPDEDEQPLFKKRSRNAKVDLVPLPSDSVFREIKLGACTSAKFNHIIGELKRHPDEKVRLPQPFIPKHSLIPASPVHHLLQLKDRLALCQPFRSARSALDSAQDLRRRAYARRRPRRDGSVLQPDDRSRVPGNSRRRQARRSWNEFDCCKPHHHARADLAAGLCVPLFRRFPPMTEGSR